MVPETFEQVLAAAQAEGSLTPAWRKFVVTKFFVPIVRASSNELSKFTLRLTQLGAPGAHSIIISEGRDLVGQEEDGMTTLSGAEVVRLLHPAAGIMVAMDTGTFNIDKDKVDWLRKGIEASKARAAAKAQEAAGAAVPAAKPAPAPVAPAAHAGAAPAASPVAVPSVAVPAAAAPPKSPDTPVTRNQRGVLDVAALKPRSVTIAKLGLDFFVPGAWTESAMSGGMRFLDPDGSTVVEATGSHREGVTLAQWQQMRMALVQHERRYLTQDGESYPLDGEGWRSRVKGMATEFTGTFPGDEVQSRYLVACIVIEGTAVSIAIRASAQEFEDNRPLYKWLLSRVDIREEAALEQLALASRPAAGARKDAPQFEYAEVHNPGVFGATMEGRIGRMRAMAYSFPVMGAAGLAGLAGSLLARTPAMGILFALAMLAFVLFASLRLMVLRLHDVNMSGKWILGFIGVMIIAAITRNPVMLAVVGILFWLMMIVIYCFIPGTDGDNDYGPPPGPNTTLVQVGAGLFILINVLALTGGVRNGRDGANAFNAAMGRGHANQGGEEEDGDGDGGSMRSAPMQTFSPGGEFRVDVPGRPQEVSVPNSFGNGVRVRHYQLNTRAAAYVMQYLYFGSVQIDQTGIMDKLKAGVIGQDGATLISDTLILVNVHKGREVRASLPGNRIRAARYVIANGKICMAMIVTSNDKAGLERIEDYLSSFDVR